MITNDIAFLHQALALAEIQRGFCSPNPAVGAVIVRDNKILAKGYHRGPGHAHAEVAALQQLNAQQTAGATMYVTLEPCCHFGRTPPCTDALIASGIKRVIYGYEDPNPLVAGRGRSILNSHGIECELLAIPDINVFYQSYQYWHRTKKPFITAKIALTLDGKIAGDNGQPIAITGDETNVLTHKNRKRSDAILTTVKTILSDDPQLNVRLDGAEIRKPLYILDSDLRLPSDAQVFRTASKITLFHKNTIPDTGKYESLGARCVGIKADKEGLCLISLISIIGEDGIHDLWIEAGGKCFSAFVRNSLLQKAWIYIAPKWLGSGMPAFEEDLGLEKTEIVWQQQGKDVLAEVYWPPQVIPPSRE